MNALLRHQSDDLRRHIVAHIIVEAPPRENHLRVIADLRRFVRQIVGVHSNAMTPDQTRPKRQEIPLRTGGLQHFFGIDAEPLEYQGKLIDQCYVDVALHVLDDLGGLGDADAAGLMRAGAYD